MLGRSRLFLGLVTEKYDAVMAQNDLWDKSNVWRAGWEQALASKAATDAEAYLRHKVVSPLHRLKEVVSDALPVTVHFKHRETASAAEPQGVDAHVMKFCRLLQHAGLSIERPPDETIIHDICLQIERHAVKALSEIDNRSLAARLRGERRQGFDGNSTDDLVRYVILRTFDQLDAEFSKKSLKEQEEIASKIAAALRDLPTEEQERIRKAARLPDLTAETLRQTGRFASLGLGLSGMVGIAGFTAYTTLTSVVAAVTGLVGIHLSFGTYYALTSGLAGLTNPFLLVPMLTGGAAWMTSKANRSIRGVLYPTLIASSVMSFAGCDETDAEVGLFTARVGALVDEIGTGGGPRTALLVARFPALGRPAAAARVASHVIP
jgi:hypothetical protein